MTEKIRRAQTIFRIARRAALAAAPIAVLLAVLLETLALPATLHAQDGKEADPASALLSALTAACKQNDVQFAIYLTADNAAAFRNLPPDERATVLHRLAVVDGPGKPLLSNSTDGHTILRCDSAGAATELRFGAIRTHENLAFIPIRSSEGDPTEFGLVRESGGWRLLSVGILLFDVPQLASRWAAQDAENHEVGAANALQDLTDAIDRYHEAYGMYPETLAQLGPAPKNEVSPDLANLITAEMATGTHEGYRYQYRVISDPDGNATGYEVSATPEQYGKTGKRSFLIDSDKRLHGADKHGDMATTDDPEVAAKLPQ